MSDTHDPLIDALSEQTRTPACPAPQVFLAAEWSALEPEAARRIAAHADRCPACRAERRLAEAFDAPGASDDLGRRRLRKALDRTDIAVELATRAPRRGGVLPMVATAAALGVLTAVLYVALGQNAPRPDRPAMRGAAIELLAPQAEHPGAVTRFEWQSRSGAQRYEVVVRAPDGHSLLRRATTGTTLTLSADELAWQRPATTYQWHVDAFDADGRRIATSRPARFRIAPSAQEGP